MPCWQCSSVPVPRARPRSMMSMIGRNSGRRSSRAPSSSRSTVRYRMSAARAAPAAHARSATFTMLPTCSRRSAQKSCAPSSPDTNSPSSICDTTARYRRESSSPPSSPSSSLVLWVPRVVQLPLLLVSCVREVSGGESLRSERRGSSTRLRVLRRDESALLRSDSPRSMNSASGPVRRCRPGVRCCGESDGFVLVLLLLLLLLLALTPSGADCSRGGCTRSGGSAPRRPVRRLGSPEEQPPDGVVCAAGTVAAVAVDVAVAIVGTGSGTGTGGEGP